AIGLRQLDRAAAEAGIFEQGDARAGRSDDRRRPDATRRDEFARRRNTIVQCATESRVAARLQLRAFAAIESVAAHFPHAVSDDDRRCAVVHADPLEIWRAATQ